MDVNIFDAQSVLVLQRPDRNMASAIYMPVRNDKNRMGHHREPAEAVRATIYSISSVSIIKLILFNVLLPLPRLVHCLLYKT